MQTIGDRIKAFRESRGFTQKQVFQATRGEVKQTTLSAIEQGAAKPGFDTLAALLQAYPQLSSDWLLRGVGPMLTGDVEAGFIIAAEPAAPYAPATAVATDPLVQQLLTQLAEQTKCHREEVREIKRDHREDIRAQATNSENVVLFMRQQIDQALAEVDRVREEKNQRIYQLEAEVYGLQLRAGLRGPTEEEAKQLEQQQAPTTKKVRGLRSYEEDVPQAEEAVAMSGWSNPSFTRPLQAEQEASHLQAA